MEDEKRDGRGRRAAFESASRCSRVQRRYTATSPEPEALSDENTPLQGGPVADAEIADPEPNLAAVVDLSRFYGEPASAGGEYDILDPVDDLAPSKPFALDPGELAPFEAAYRHAETIAIQEFGA